MVISQYLKHFKDVVEEGVGFDVLIVLIGAAVAALVEPRHRVDSCRLISKGADVLFEGHWFKQLQQAFDSHFKVITTYSRLIYRPLRHDRS